MKTYTIFLALFTFGVAGSAQKIFTQATLKQMLEDYKSDSKAFLVNRMSESFSYSDPKGKFIHKSDIATIGTQKAVSTSDAQKIVSTLQALERMVENVLTNDVLEPVIIQSCDLAILNGRHQTTWVGSDSKEVMGEVAGTYTFQRRKGKWIFAASQQTAMDEK